MSNDGPAPRLDRVFPLDHTVLGPGSALGVELSGTTDADVARALLRDAPFPERPDGDVGLAHIGITATGERPVAFEAGTLAVGVTFSAGVTAAAGIFDDPQHAIAAIGLRDAPGVNLGLPHDPDARYAMLTAGYTASGSVEGTHPVGALGSFTFGASGARTGLLAVLHRFRRTDGARTAFENTVRSLKLPRHIGTADALAPGTWLISEADGSLAVNLAARLGYNFNFVREARAAGLSGDIGLKIDAAAIASFGFEVSGRFLVVLSRDADALTDSRVRLRLFKLSSHGLRFGLNLHIGVTGVETVAPDTIDDFVEAVFGVHGVQIVTALANLEQWTDPTKSVGDLIAGLVNDRALELLNGATGLNPRTAFDGARAALLGAIRAFQELPSGVAGELWTLLGDLDGPAAAVLHDTLILLASREEAVQQKALLEILQTKTFAATPAGRLISALGDRGLLNLLDRLPEVRKTASTLLFILDGGVMIRLDALLRHALDLNKVMAALTRADFDALDSFLLGRLSAFFDKTLHFTDLAVVKNAIGVVMSKRKAIYDNVQKALNSRYGADMAVTWEKTTADTAVVDVVVDTSPAAGQKMLAAMVRSADFDQVLRTDDPAVRLNAAVLSHEITRKTTIDVTLPHFDFQDQSFNDSMATVAVEDDGPRVLLYNGLGQDVVAVRNKFRSSLAVTISAIAPKVNSTRLPDLRVHSTDSATWSYQLLHAKRNMRRSELEAYTRPFIEQYMARQFAGGSALDAWYDQLDQTVDSVLHNGPDQFGDVCARFEVTVPGEILGAWARPMGDVTLAAKRMSKAIQASLKHVVPFYYLSELAHLGDLVPTAAVLTWSAIRPTNDIQIDGDRITFDVGREVFWNHVDPTARRLMIDNQITAANLRARLAPLRLRLEDAGRHGEAQFYRDDKVPQIIAAATSDVGGELLRGLLLFESVMVNKAADALRDIQGFIEVAAASPSKAIERLADFAADITTAFNKLVGNTVFGGLSFRAVSQAALLDASRALAPAMAAVEPRALLTLTVLRPQPPRTFNLQDFMRGAIPEGADVVVAQNLVSV